MKHTPYVITITNYQWSCGDGCCSDSGYKGKVHNRETGECVYNNDNWDCNRDRNDMKEQCIEALSHHLGHEVFPADYSFHYEVEDSGGGETYDDDY